MATDTTLPSKIQLFELIKKDNPIGMENVSIEDVNFSTPTTPEGQSNPVTEITVSGKKDSGYTGNVSLIYNRLNMADFNTKFPSAELYVPSSVTAADIVDDINTVFDAGFTTDDYIPIESLPTPTDTGFNFVLKAHNDSIGYYGELTIPVYREMSPVTYTGNTEISVYEPGELTSGAFTFRLDLCSTNENAILLEILNKNIVVKTEVLHLSTLGGFVREQFEYVITSNSVISGMTRYGGVNGNLNNVVYWTGNYPISTFSKEASPTIRLRRIKDNGIYTDISLSFYFNKAEFELPVNWLSFEENYVQTSKNGNNFYPSLNLELRNDGEFTLIRHGTAGGDQIVNGRWLLEGLNPIEFRVKIYSRTFQRSQGTWRIASGATPQDTWYDFTQGSVIALNTPITATSYGTGYLYIYIDFEHIATTITERRMIGFRLY